MYFVIVVLCKTSVCLHFVTVLSHKLIYLKYELNKHEYWMSSEKGRWNQHKWQFKNFLGCWISAVAPVDMYIHTYIRYTYVVYFVWNKIPYGTLAASLWRLNQEQNRYIHVSFIIFKKPYLKKKSATRVPFNLYRSFLKFLRTDFQFLSLPLLRRHIFSFWRVIFSEL